MFVWALTIVLATPRCVGVAAAAAEMLGGSTASATIVGEARLMPGILG
jgi:hypothetical protein